MNGTQKTELIKEYIGKRCADRLEKMDQAAEKQRKNLAVDAMATFDIEYAAKRIAEADRYVPANWISDAAMRAGQISFVTHAIKFTHGDAKGSGVLVQDTSIVAHDYLTTSNLGATATDVVGNAAALDVASFLQLSDGTDRLLDQVARRDPISLAPFAADSRQVDDWLDGLRSALTGGAASSHTLAKQIYFPVAGGTYHLLAPLASSALIQAIYARVSASRFGEEMKVIRTARKERKHHPGILTHFVGLAVQSFGGTKPQNISLGNSQRRGKAFLLNCAPPNWRSRMTPPDSTERFWRTYLRATAAPRQAFRRFLEVIHDKPSDAQIRQHRELLARPLVDELIQYAAQLRQLPAGWSMSSKIDIDLACLLDPGREDSDFRIYRDGEPWREMVALAFSRSMNTVLRSDKWLLGDVENRYWVDLALADLEDLP